MLQDKNDATINDYIRKESSKKFFNSTRLAVTGRVGYGILVYMALTKSHRF